MVDGYGSNPGADVNQGHAAGHFIFGEDGVGHHFRQEVFLGDGDVQLVEDLVQGGGGAAVADKHLEIALQRAAERAHYLVFHQLDLIVNGEGLGHGTVHNLPFGVGEGIGLQGHGFEVLHFLGGNVVVGIGARDAGGGGYLRHLAAGHAHHHLQDLDHQFLFRLPDGFLEAGGRLHRVGDEAGTDAF